MKQHSRIQLPWGLGTFLILALLTLILLRVIVLSIRVGNAETGLFVEFYLLSMPLDVIIRRCFKNKKFLPWYYWAGWICRWAGIVMIALSFCHLALGGPWETLLVPEVYDSELWTDMAILPLRWIFSISGIAVMVGRRETRKKALIHSAVTFFAMFAILGVTNQIWPLKNSREISNLLANMFLFLIPHLHGLGGALFYPLWGKMAGEADAARKAARASTRQPLPQPASPRRPAPASPAAAAPVSAGRPAAPATAAPASPIPARAAWPQPAPPKPRTTTVNPAAPRNIEKELSDQKAAYEARMRKMAAVRENTLKEASVNEMLEKTAVRLFSEGQAAASLGGQRQLIYWMAQATPRLNGLIRQPAGKRFFAPALPDDPDAFLPLLDALLAEAVRLLESGEASGRQEDTRQTADPEALCAGWYALTRFAAVSSDGAALSREADRLAAHFKKDKPCNAWLKNAYENAEEGEPV